MNLLRLSKKAVSYSSPSMTNHGLSVKRAPWPKIVWDAADQKARVQPVVFKDPGQQRGGGGLAVRAGDDQASACRE